MDLKVRQVAEAAFAKWAPLCANEEEAQLTMPVHVLLGEAVDVAAMIQHYWEPRSDTRNGKLPGLSGVTGGPAVTLETANEIQELQLAVTVAHTQYLVLVQAAGDSPLDRADFVLSELRSALGFVFDDGKHDAGDEQLARLEQAFSDSASQDAMALALEGYSELARLHQDALAKLGGFDTTLIDEAFALAGALRNQSAAALTRVNPDEQRRALSLRNRLLTLVIDRVRRGRRADQYVFRDQPEVLRKFASVHERRRRATRGRKAAQVENAARQTPPAVSG